MKEKQYSELEILVKEVLKKRDRIIPVIGDDAFEGYVECDNMEFRFPFQRWLAEMLLAEDSTLETKEKIYREGYRGLDLMYEEYKRINSEENFVEYKETIINIVEKGIKEKKLFLRKDVKEFLIAGNFEVIATTCPYHILETELSISKNRYNVCSFAPISARQSSKVSRSEETLMLPSIYQIFGDCDGEFVSGEEDLLKFLHYLNQTNTEKGFGASQLVKYIKDKGQDNKGLGLLMPIGCNNLPNWLFRFLWYPFSQDCLIGRDKNNQGGVWYKHSPDETFYKFLKKYRFRTFSGSTDILKTDDSDEDPVLKRITEEFVSTVNYLNQYISTVLQVQTSNTGDWDIFISYAREDRDFAKKVYDILTNSCHKTVWMDTRGGIKAGDGYWEAIQHGIEHSNRFIFIISESYLQKAIGKNYVDQNGQVGPTGVFREIDLIINHLVNKRKDGQKGFSIPLIIHGTKVTYTDSKGLLHKDEELRSGILEKLPHYKEYEVMQTDKLFNQVQDLICKEDTLQTDIENIFI